MIYILSVIGAVLLVIYIVNLVKKEKLDEHYSIFWLLFSFLFVLFSLSPKIIEFFAKELDIKYAPSILFFFGILFILGYLIHLSIVVTKQNKMLISLTQEISLLKEQVLKTKK